MTTRYDPLNPPRDPVTACGRSCCWSPYLCSRSRQCACHAADPVIPRTENAVRRITYQDHTAGNAVSNVMRKKGGRR